MNCLVPAKLGDVYRAYLLKINAPVSLTRTFGTVFIERILDLFAIAILGLAAGFWSFRSGLPPEIQIVVALGVGAVIVLLAVGLLTLRNFGRRILVRLPLPHRVLELYDRFEEGVFGRSAAASCRAWCVLTVLIWTTEGLRLWLVVQALGFPDVSLGHLRRVLRRAHRVAAHGRAAQPGGPRRRRAGIVGVLLPCVRRPADRGDDDRPRRPRDQRVLDHRHRLDRCTWSPQRQGLGLSQRIELPGPAAT